MYGLLIYTTFMLSHDGGVSGFTAENMVFPDDSAAIVVFDEPNGGNRCWHYCTTDYAIDIQKTGCTNTNANQTSKKHFYGTRTWNH